MMPRSTSCPPAWAKIPDFSGLALASQELIDQAQRHEMERLRHGGEHGNPNEDFTFYLILPLLILVGLIVVGRRIIS
jgi:hypothetical protein